MTTKKLYGPPLTFPLCPERVLAIDASTEATGYALIHAGNLVWSCEDNTHAYHGNVPQVLRHYFLFLKKVISEQKPDIIIFEDVAMFDRRTAITVITLARLSAIPYLVSGTIPVYKINVSSWKAKIIGSGSAPKSASIQWVSDRYGITVKDNEADAICIGQMWQFGKEKLK